MAAAVASLSACAARAPRVPRAPHRPPAPRSTPAAIRALPRIEYSIQVGAFSDPDNALRLVQALAERGLEAFYYKGANNLYRVRCGSFPTRERAIDRAQSLQREALIDDYAIVMPEILAPSGGEDDELRRKIVETALSFQGRPYRWGSDAPESGLDCSGLTMAAYRLHGLALPRTSAAQYAAGQPLDLADLRAGDLVFFATQGGERPTHVGLYLGDGRFIHAPRRGSVVRIDEMASTYYERRFLSGRDYLQ
jgi:hypothetical protein